MASVDMAPSESRGPDLELQAAPHPHSTDP